MGRFIWSLYNPFCVVTSAYPATKWFIVDKQIAVVGWDVFITLVTLHDVRSLWGVSGFSILPWLPYRGKFAIIRGRNMNIYNKIVIILLFCVWFPPLSEGHDWDQLRRLEAQSRALSVSEQSTRMLACRGVPRKVAELGVDGWVITKIKCYKYE